MSSRQKGQNKRKHDHLSFCVYRMGVLGGRCQHWNEEIERESTDARDRKDKQEHLKKKRLDWILIFFGCG